MNSKMKNVLSAVGGCDAVIICTEVSRRYLLGFPSSDGTLIIKDDGAVFIIDGRYSEAARAAVRDAEVIEQNKLFEQIKSILGGCKTVAVETALPYRTVSAFRNALSDYDVKALPEMDREIEKMRGIKSAEEVDNIKAAQGIAELAFDHILGFIKPGVSDIEIAAELEYVMRRNGAERMAFDTIAISGAVTSMPHGVPTCKKVENGDFVTMDFGAVVNGCHSDMTRTVAVGDVTDEMRKVYGVVLDAQKAALDALKAGLLCSDGDLAARKVIANAGYGECFTHATGHSVGYEIHESPTLSPSAKGTLSAGNVVTVEPGIYIAGRFGVRIEDMALITENGCENLTSAKKELIVL